jgi:hypothetical protein
MSVSVAVEGARWREAVTPVSHPVCGSSDVVEALTGLVVSCAGGVTAVHIVVEMT